MELVGCYARVSTREGQQVFDRQVDALRAAGCKRIYDQGLRMRFLSPATP